MERRNAVGFYWTLPVPRAGFTELPDRIEDAARASRTIRYQREAVHRHARDNGYTLVHEEVFLEIDPDRSSEFILGPLRKVGMVCRQHGATLLYVDFSEVQGWRSHPPMEEWCRSAVIPCQTLFPDEVLIDGQLFDPSAHFQAWRTRQRAWTASKAERATKLLERAEGLRGGGLSYSAIAAAMNDEGLVNLTGRKWTADNVRKFIARFTSQPLS